MSAGPGDVKEREDGLDHGPPRSAEEARGAEDPAAPASGQGPDGRSPEGSLEAEEAAAIDSSDEAVEAEASFLSDPRRIGSTVFVVVLLVAAIYILFPKIIGLEGSFNELGSGDPVWLTIAVAFNVVAFAAYVALFRGVVGENVLHLEWRESYQITMAGLAATRLFSAGGAGGIVLTYWALRKAGMPQRDSACRMVAFLVLLYAVYMLALVIDGILLRTGVLNGPNPAGLTIVPAALAGTVIVIFLGIALIPHDFERRLAEMTRGYRFRRLAHRLASVPATLAMGTRTAIGFLGHPRRGGLAMLGATGFWAANIGILWASFHAFDVEVPLGVVVQGFFVGMVANLIPSPSGVGAVDAGMIGTFVLFGYPGSEVFAAVLAYRVIAFWLPIPPGVVAFFQLRRTALRWDAERGRAPVGSDTAESLPGAAITSESKVT